MKCRECGANPYTGRGHMVDCPQGYSARKYCIECRERVAKPGNDYCSIQCYNKARRLNGL